MLSRSFLLLILLFEAKAGVAQQAKIAPMLGVIKGTAFDSVHNYPLPSATVAIYKQLDTGLVNYMLSNNLGEFYFTKVPVGVKLNVVINYIGYGRYEKKGVILETSNQVIDIGEINLLPQKNDLKEVVIRALPPPVVLKGDTLEFNAGAFELDKNAVVEDLLYKLPGITVWGDGTITVNGKKVSSVLVNGKPFFGGNTQVATQNLPKNIVEKIQVYQKSDKELDGDSTMEVNIMLKKNVKQGHFGKLAGGGGTRQSYDADGNLNIFSPHTEIQIIGGGNNVNKFANNIESAVRNASFKGIGASIEFNPDFSRQGTNQQNFGGLSFKHDFSRSPVKELTKQLKIEYFINEVETAINRDSEAQINLNDNYQQFLGSNTNNDSRRLNQKFDIEYREGQRFKSFYVNSSIETDKSIGFSRSFTVLSDFTETQSNNNALTDFNDSFKKGTMRTGFSYNNPNASSKSILERISYNIDYLLSMEEGINIKNNETDFISFINSNENRFYRRSYDANGENVGHKFNITIGDVQKIINGSIFSRKGISLSFRNEFVANTNRENNLVTDLLPGGAISAINSSLTATSKYRTYSDIPELVVAKAFNKSLHGRFQNTLNLNLNLRAQFYSQYNISQINFQNFNRHNQSFIPEISISYNNNVFSSYQNIYTLKYTTSNKFPGVNELVPLVDSLNTWYLHMGNVNLRPAYKQNLLISIAHFNSKKNTSNFHINLNLGSITDAISDSTIYSTGKIIHYYYNTPNNKYLSLNAELNKAFKFTNQTLEFSLNGFYNIGSNVNFINSISTPFVQRTVSNSVSGLYRFKDFFALSLVQDYGFFVYDSRSQKYTNKYFSTSASSSLSIKKKLFLNSNISFKENISSISRPINFTIWNIGIGRRFLEQNNLELKVSALDLLRENTSVLSANPGNGIDITTVNVLQQYYMLSISYFPRKFGSKKK